MAALLEMVRDHKQHPAMSQKERDAEYGTYTPTTRRASAQRNSANAQVPTRTTDDLKNEPHTGKRPTPLRRGGSDDNHGYYQPSRSFWSIILKGLSYLAGIVTILYTIVFFIVAGCLLVANLVSYGPTHTAYTNTTINGQPTTIESSNVNGNIHITLITTGTDGSITYKTYSGPTLEPSAWNNDMSGIVATAEKAPQQTNPTITVNLIGSVNYFHPFFARPHMKLLLVPDKHTGYTVVVAS